MSSVAELLLDTARKGELHHAILLHGPDQTAMHQLAIRIAKTLNCTNGSTGDDCVPCRKIERGTHPDVHLTVVAEDRKLISAGQVRSTISDASLRPYEGRCKVFIIEPAEAMSASAANALLKTLEEPTADTVFILSTRSADLLLPTIRSRAQPVYVGPAATRPAREIASERAVSIQAARLHLEDLASPPGETSSEDLARGILALLGRYARHGDAGALLGIAPLVTSTDNPGRGITLLAMVLRDLAALSPSETVEPSDAASVQENIPRPLLIEGAAIAIRSAGRLAVNADPRLLVEQSLAALTRK